MQLFLPSPEAEVVGQSNSLNLRRVRSLQGEARHEQWLNWSRCSGLLKEFHQGDWHLLTGWPSMHCWEREGPDKNLSVVQTSGRGAAVIAGGIYNPSGTLLPFICGGQGYNTITHAALREVNYEQVTHKTNSLLLQQTHEQTLGSDLKNVGRAESMETTPLKPSDFMAA